MALINYLSATGSVCDLKYVLPDLSKSAKIYIVWVQFKVQLLFPLVMDSRICTFSTLNVNTHRETGHGVKHELRTREIIAN